MLPFPGHPSSSWPMYRARLQAIFAGADPRVCIAFWLFGRYPPKIAPDQLVNDLGLINNVLYVVILSAALDLVGPNVPKGVVLVANILPSFVIKLCAPYFIHSIPYSVRILLMTALSSFGMLLIALTPAYTDGGTIAAKMVGVAVASVSSGGGEQSFLGLTHFYGPFSLAAWGSGTGGAGLLGAGAYAVATTSFGLSVKSTLLASSCLPIMMLVGFFAILPLGPLKAKVRSKSRNKLSASYVDEYDVIEEQEENFTERGREREGLLRRISTADSILEPPRNWWSQFNQNLHRSQKLFIP